MNYQNEQFKTRWNELNFFQQMANVGSEVIRAINWREKNKEYSQGFIDKALELLDMTISDKKNQTKNRLREILRLREVLVDYFYFDNIYKSNDSSWNNYFLAFNYAANI
jgi:hypothetical protein